MSVRTPYVPSLLRDKRNHFLSKYHLIIQDRNWFNGDTEDIKSLDPFRGKIRHIWTKVSDGSGSKAFGWDPPSSISLALPISVTNQPLGGFGSNLQIRFANLSGPVYNGHNLYRQSFVETIDLFCETSATLADRAIKTLLLTLFLPSSFRKAESFSEYDNNSAVELFAVSGPGADTQLLVNSSGIVQWNHVENAEKTVNEFMFRMLRRVFFPLSYSSTSTSRFKHHHTPLRVDSKESKAGDNFHSVGSYWDDVYSIDRFVSTQAIETVASLEDKGNFSGVYFADVDPVYNFLVTNYENTLLNEDVTHTKIPNIYNELEKLNGPLGMDGTSNPDEFLEGVLTGEKIANVWWSNYFKTYENMLGKGTLSKVRDKFKHIYVKPQGHYSNQSIDEYKELFPMYNDISFRSHSGNSKFMSALRSAGAVEDLWKDIIIAVFGHHEPKAIKKDIEVYAGELSDYSPYSTSDPHSLDTSLVTNSIRGTTDFKFPAGAEKLFFDCERNQNNSSAPSNFVHSQVAVFNFDHWFQNYPNTRTQAQLAEFDTKATMFVSSDSGKEAKSKNPLVTLLQGVTQKAELAPKITQLARTLVRSYKDILSGKHAYSEVLFYRIQKRQGNNTLQNFWLENTPGIDVLKYVDTQVKYGVDYEYRIYAYTLVVGTKYRYAANELAENGEKIPFLLDKSELGTGEYKYYNGETFRNGAPKFYLSKYVFDHQKAANGNNPLNNGEKFGSGVAAGYFKNPEPIHDIYESTGGDFSEEDSFDDLGTNIRTMRLFKDYSFKYPDTIGLIYELYQEELAKVPGIRAQMEEKNLTQNEVATIRGQLGMFIRLQLEKHALTLLKSLNGFEPWINDLVYDDESEQRKKLIVWEYNNLIEFTDIGNLYALYMGITSENPINILSVFQMLEGGFEGYDTPELQQSISSLKDIIKDLQMIVQKFDAQRQILEKYMTVGMEVEGNEFKQEKMSVKGYNVDPDNVFATPMTPSDINIISEAIPLRNTQIGILNGIISEINKTILKLDPIIKEIGDNESTTFAEIQIGLNQDISALNTSINLIFGEDQNGMDDFLEILRYEAMRYKLQDSYFKITGMFSTNKRSARMQVVSEPFIKVVETPVYGENISVVDDAPLPPSVNFYSYFKNENRLLISLDNTVGEEIAEQILLPGDDEVAAEKIRRKQDRDYVVSQIDGADPENIDYVNKKVRFKADDYALGFQVFRKTRKPKNLLDYDGGDLLFTIDALKGPSFIDSIVPNTKYYYCFRAIDKHGHPSNPTPTYEIELVSDGGATFLLIEVVDFSEKDKGINYKSFKRYMQIDPAFLQTLINQDKSVFGDFSSAFGTEPYLGVLEDSIFDEKKKFKIRVTSRATGKKLDFNVRFRKALDQTIKTPPVIL